MTERTGRILNLDDAVSTTDEIVKSLEEISKQMTKILTGRLTEDAIIVLIREMLPRGSKLGPQQIREVLHAARDLDKRYLKKEPSR